MAALIRKESIREVAERVRIDDIVGDVVTLRTAGIGSLKGLCPFHDEKTPSFHVRPQVNHWHCFGCGEGGDVINFVQRYHHMSFVEAVEYLAGKSGVTLQYEESRGPAKPQDPARRQRIIEAHVIAEKFYRQALESAEAAPGREFLLRRGFEADSWEKFGIGYSPNSWDAMLGHLRRNGFTEAEIEHSGLVSRGNRGVYDRFRGRLMWPIRDITGQSVGFGARKLSDEDGGPKYLNTPETNAYKKSQVLYGLDLAKRAVAQKKQIVVVEGYTDVMAAHLSGVDTAVATCGTAFGSEHVRIVRRILGDSANAAAGVMLASGRAHGGEVIFTFDGDAAGKKAALRAFNEDQNFASQTFVAISPGGMDPCDLRLKEGPEAIAKLVSSRVPLFEFVIKTVLDGLDLETVEGRVNALRAVAPVLNRIRDVAMRSGYQRVVAGWIGVPESEVRQAVKAAGRSGGVETRVEAAWREPEEQPKRAAIVVTGDPFQIRLEREALEVALQLPVYACALQMEHGDVQMFTDPHHRRIFEAMKSPQGFDYYRAELEKLRDIYPDGTRAEQIAGSNWVEHINKLVGSEYTPLISSYAVSVLKEHREEHLPEYARAVITALFKSHFTRVSRELASRLKRMQPGDPREDEVFREMLKAEKYRRSLGG